MGTKPGFSRQAQVVFEASQKLWHESDVERHAEGAPGLKGPPSQGPYDLDLAFIDSAIYTLESIRTRLTQHHALTDREWQALTEIEAHQKTGRPYTFTPKTSEELVRKGLARSLKYGSRNRYLKARSTEKAST
jgi:hypothetical protein